MRAARGRTNVVFVTWNSQGQKLHKHGFWDAVFNWALEARELVVVMQEADRQIRRGGLEDAIQAYGLQALRTNRHNQFHIQVVPRTTLNLPRRITKQIVVTGSSSAGAVTIPLYFTHLFWRGAGGGYLDYYVLSSFRPVSTSAFDMDETSLQQYRMGTEYGRFQADRSFLSIKSNNYQYVGVHAPSRGSRNTFGYSNYARKIISKSYDRHGQLKTGATRCLVGGDLNLLFRRAGDTSEPQIMNGRNFTHGRKASYIHYLAVSALSSNNNVIRDFGKFRRYYGYSRPILPRGKTHQSGKTLDYFWVDRTLLPSNPTASAAPISDGQGLVSDHFPVVLRM